MSKLHLLFIALLSNSISINSFSQGDNNFLVKKVLIKGLPIETELNSLQQDDEGFLWLGGLSGLYRYDGTRVHRFLRDPADSNSLTHNYANTLTKDSLGNIWIGTFGGFMNMFESKSAKIKRIESGVQNPARLVVRKTKAANDGNIIAATALGFFKINLSGVVIDSILIPSTQYLNNAGITDFVEYENNKFIITSTTGIFLLDWQIKSMTLATFLPAGKIYHCIDQDNAGNFWIGSDSTLFIVKQNFSVSNTNAYSNNSQLNNTVIHCLQKDRRGRIWLGTSKGLFLADQNEIVQVGSTNTDSLKDITELFVDKQATVWLYAAGKGLYQVYQPQIVFNTIPGMDFYSRNQLIQTITEERSGTWNIGTRQGLYRYQFSSKSFEEIDLTNNPKNKPWIGAQLIDRNNGYWVGTFGQGVFYRAAGATEFIHFTNQQDNDNSLPSNTIVSLAEDKNGMIWMGNFNSGNQPAKNGLCYYNPNTKQIRRLRNTFGDKTYKAISTSQIEPDSQGDIWLGSWDLGLLHYYGNGILEDESKFRNYTEASPQQQKISHNVVSCIRPGRNNNIWFGSISGGLNVLDTKSGNIRWYTIKDGLPSNLIYRIEEDDQGKVWMSTDNGIARFDPDSRSFINYNTTSGLPANDFAFLTSVKCQDGTIAFGTSNGQVVYFNPNRYKELVNTLPVKIADIRLFNKSIDAGPDELLKEAAYFTDTLNLEYDHSVISFELSNMDFLNPEIFTYAYMLEGFDKDWTYINDRNSITYTNLDPGTYKLQIKNANHLGIWNENPTLLTLIIQPPYWRTWWFATLIILLAFAIIYIVFRYRLQQKLKIYAVRNRLHRDLHDDVGATLSSVKAYSEILKNNPDNLMIAELIKDNSTEMLDKLEIIAWATNPDHDHFKSLKGMMAKFAAPLCHSKNIVFNIHCNNVDEEMLLTGEVRQNIYLIFKEAINNMIKYADATTCDTIMTIEHHQLILKIIDNGKGFDGIVKGTGNGSRNMQKRAQELNGSLLIHSAPGKGTTITASFPYPFKIPNSWDMKKRGL